MKEIKIPDDDAKKNNEKLETEKVHQAPGIIKARHQPSKFANSDEELSEQSEASKSSS